MLGDPGAISSSSEVREGPVYSQLQMPQQGLGADPALAWHLSFLPGLSLGPELTETHFLHVPPFPQKSV